MNSQESESFILVGLENGSVTAYHFNTSYRKSMTIITNIELHSNVPVQKMCSVNARFIAVACGMNIYFLQVWLPGKEAAGSAYERRSVTVPELINCGSVSLKHIVSVYDPIVAMVSEGNAVWCSLENSACLVKVDLDLKKVASVVKLNWEPVHDIVRLEEIVTSAARSKNSVSESSCSDDFCKQQLHRHSDSESVKSGKDSYMEVPGLVITDESANGSDKPPVPPRVFLTNETRSTEDLRTQKPPPVPIRMLGQNINVTSLERSVDILILGTSCGGIVLLPLSYSHDSETSGSLPTLPFKLPVLRHSGKKKMYSTRSRSFTTDSPEQAVRTTGSVSALSLTSDKLVSLHSVQQQILRDKPSRSKGKDARRDGSLFTHDSLLSPNCCAHTSKACPSGAADNNNLSRVHSALFPHSDIAGADRRQSCEIADIAVWDNITWDRLKTVRSYSHDLFKCTGWCCQASEHSFK